MSSHGNDTDSFGNKRPEKLDPSDAISLHKPKSIVERRTFHETNLILMSKIYCSPSLASNSFPGFSPTARREPGNEVALTSSPSHVKFNVDPGLRSSFLIA